jgi:glutathione synthase/RimK-type ligase-like ATP-grasp enzyme
VHTSESPAPVADVLLATIGTGRRQYDEESPLLVAALAQRGLRAEIVAWDAPVQWGAAALVVVRSPWDYTECHGRFLEWLRATAARTCVVNDAELIAWNMHKGYLVELGRAGVPVVPTTLLRRGAGAADQAAALREHGEDVVIKPAISAGARGTILTGAVSEQAAAHLAGLLEDGDALIQPYVPAVAAGEVSLVLFGGVLSHAVRKLPASGDFRVQEEHGGTVVAHVAAAAEHELAASVLAAVPVAPAYARIDVVTTARGPLLMEAELIEPELFLAADRDAPARFAAVLAQHAAARA